MRRRALLLVLGLLALAGAGVAVGTSAGRGARPFPAFSPVLQHLRLAAAEPGVSEPGVLVAHARGRSLSLFVRPGRAQGRRRLAEHVVLGRRIPLALLVRARRRAWLRVALPLRPNESTAWIRARDVTLRRNPFRIRVDLRGHRLTAWRGTRVMVRSRIVGGARATPTPPGAFYVTERIRTPDPRGAYGPWALGLSAHSAVLTEFAGGDGQVAIHGTNTPSNLGTDVSHGCVRVPNLVIRRLAGFPVGTPVVVRR